MTSPESGSPVFRIDSILSGHGLVNPRCNSEGAIYEAQPAKFPHEFYAPNRERRAVPERQLRSAISRLPLPVHFRLQFAFRECEVEAPDDDEPEITSDALRALEQELEEFISKKYVIDSLEVFDDALDAVFLGRDSG